MNIRNHSTYYKDKYAKGWSSAPTSKNFVIGMVVDKLSDHFCGAVVRSMTRLAAIHNFIIFASDTENKPAGAVKIIRAMRARQVDGYVIAPMPGIRRQISMLIREGRPVIQFDRSLPGLDTHKVSVNNYKAALDATAHLIGKGRRNILFVTFNPVQTHLADRVKGYKDAMNESLLEPCISTMEYTAVERVLHRRLIKAVQAHLHADAIFFAAHALTIAGLKVLKSMNIVIPVHTAVVGFDDAGHFDLFSPPVTSIVLPVNKIASEIARLLAGSMYDEGGQLRHEDVVLDTTLVVRNSSY